MKEERRGRMMDESLWSEAFWNGLKETYGLQKEEDLYPYLALRFLLFHPKYRSLFLKKREIQIEFFRFLFDELHIQPIQFQQTSLTFTYQDNGILGVIDDYLFGLERYSIDLRAKLEEIEHQNLKYRRNSTRYQYENLCTLNKQFQIKDVKDFVSISGFPQLSADLCLSREIRLKRELDATLFQSQEVKEITEQELQSYLMKHLDLIEDGLHLIETEHPIGDGRIDILARDQNDQLVIIELKIADDERLPWQCMYYPMAIQKEYPKIKVRMITIAPHYKSSIRMVLQKLPVEMWTFQVISTNHKIESLKMRKEKIWKEN